MTDKIPAAPSRAQGDSLCSPIVDATLTTCPRCQVCAASQTPHQVYDRIELPPVKPDVTRVRLFGGRCACCRERVSASAPAGLEPGSPFGQSVAAMVVCLHYAHAIGLERLAALMGEIFALPIQRRCAQQHAGPCACIPARHDGDDPRNGDRQSGGVFRRDLGTGHGPDLVGMGVRRHARGCTSSAPVAAKPSCSPCSAPSGRRSGRPTCSAASAATVRTGRYAWCICCAMRSTRSRVDAAFSAAFKRLLLRAIAIGRRREKLKDTILQQYRADLDRRLDRVMAVAPIEEVGRKLRKRIAANLAHLFVFVTDRNVPYTKTMSPSETFAPAWCFER
jgi:transposase